ncbi:ATP-binding protein [Microcoleus vaginatus DQ-U2]|uniref:ATP-binding protein n=1 Tax=Microcoleus vaginatus TaxID=119532 RepID=UPI001685BCFF|nr:ATP-binding protein [Microcoleus sp. FACHB-DQ6]
MTKQHDIVPVHLVVQAMRDNGYKNAAYALAELIDNSIQAGATEVELLCAEKETQLEQRRRSRIHQIAVLDNGSGMDNTVLRMALQFGNGTYLAEDKHTGIGRFGMGLPCSSLSQCQRVEVWTWQSGVEKAIYTYLDLNEIKNKNLTEVPEPKKRKIPEIWEKVTTGFGQTGTLVVWSDIDRCMWKTGKTIIENSEFVIGRMYRIFLDTEEVVIRMATFDINEPTTIMVEKFAQPNDPGYLMAETSCPPPFDKKPMFQAWDGEDSYEYPFFIDFRGQKHEGKIRFSYAKEEARPGNNPGSLPHGQHAKKNVGVSVVRARRELELDQSWSQKKPTERWWGVEIEFPPALDDLFGVTNNKQSARNFSEMANLDIESMLKDGKTISQLKEELTQDEDPRGPLIEIAHKINTQLKIMRNWLEAQTKGSRSTPKRHNVSSAEKVATEVTEERKKEGHYGQSDENESLALEERKEIIETTLIDKGVMQITAEELAAKTVSDGLKYVFANASLGDKSAFFSVDPKPGTIIITLNTIHPAYKNLVEILEEEVEGVDPETLRSRLTNSLEGLKLLLMAWARYEDEQPHGPRRNKAQDARVDWGRVARQFLEGDE